MQSAIKSGTDHITAAHQLKQLPRSTERCILQICLLHLRQFRTAVIVSSSRGSVVKAANLGSIPTGTHTSQWRGQEDIWPTLRAPYRRIPTVHVAIHVDSLHVGSVVTSKGPSGSSSYRYQNNPGKQRQMLPIFSTYCLTEHNFTNSSGRENLPALFSTIETTYWPVALSYSSISSLCFRMSAVHNTHIEVTVTFIVIVKQLQTPFSPTL